jgi:hypothetical protein
MILGFVILNDFEICDFKWFYNIDSFLILMPFSEGKRQFLDSPKKDKKEGKKPWGTLYLYP